MARAGLLALADNGRVPEISPSAERRAREREAGRRRRAVGAQRTGASMCAHTAQQVGNGASPEQARQALLEAAGALASLAAELRRRAPAAPG